MSELTFKKESGRKIAVLGERELVMGYRLLGIDDTFTMSMDAAEVNKTLQRLMSSKEFGLIIASHSVRNALSEGFRESVEASIEPLVLFLPAFQGNIEEESISSLARRVLGISIQMGVE
jgi:V/A-type H+-transporting ATPase subunit F